MTKLTEQLVAQLDGAIIENFADLYVLEAVVARIEKQHDLADADVIAALATCADVACVQQRLAAQPPASLVAGLTAALDRGKLRATSDLLVRALLDGAKREVAAPPPAKSKKPLPVFARPARLPPLVGGPADTEAFVRSLVTAKLGDPPESAYSTESLAALGRALVLGWLAHGAEAKHAWAAHAAAHFPDDATARDLGMMARELGPRVGQFSKAQILVDVIAAMDTRAALAVLQELIGSVKTKSVRERAKTAFDAAAKRVGVTAHDLADKLIVDERTVGNDFVKRLEDRMVTGTKMRAFDFIESILQREALRRRARGVVFGAHIGSHVVAFTIVGDRLVDIDGEDVELPATAQISVMHPFDLSAKWELQITAAPFPQLDRPIRRFPSLRAMTKHAKSHIGKRVSRGAVFGLEAVGWRRGVAGAGGSFMTIERELDGLTAIVRFGRGGIYLGRGPASAPPIADIEITGKGTPRAMAEIAREIDLLVP